MVFFIYALQFLFITLKLVGIISWSWWLVLLPLIVIVVLNTLAIIALVSLSAPKSTKEFDKLVSVVGSKK